MAVLVTLIYADVVRAVLPQLPDTLVYLVSFGFVVTLFGSVFLHELGHALVSRYYRIPVRSITLEMLGGRTEMAAEAERPKAEALIALAGPAVSAVLGLIGVAAVVMIPPHTISAQFAFQVAACNILVAVYNALPGLPLDGGQALRALVWAVKGDKHLASRVAGRVGRGVAVATGAAGAVLYYTDLVGLLAILFGFMVAAMLWVGATRAIQLGTIGARFHLLEVTRLLRRAVEVVPGTPLAEVLRRVADQDAAGALVVDSGGHAQALMTSASVEAVPRERRPWVRVDDVSRSLDPDTVWNPRWRGEEVIRAMRRHPANEYAVVEDGLPLGIVRSADIVAMLDPRGGNGPTDSASSTVHHQEDHQT